MDNTQINAEVDKEQVAATPAIAVDERIEKEIRRRRTFLLFLTLTPVRLLLQKNCSFTEVPSIWLV